MRTPDPEVVGSSNLAALMAEVGADSYADLHHWSVQHRAEFWEATVRRLGIAFAGDPGPTLGDDGTWFPDARLNIVESCFAAPGDAIAVVAAAGDAIEKVTFAELEELVGAAAVGLADVGVGHGDRVAIAMPMTLEAVVAYLGIAAVGGVVVSIADSFAPDEIATRLRISGAQLVVTADAVRRAGKVLPMYDKVVAAGASRAIVVGEAELRRDDVSWDRLMSRPAQLSPAVEPANAHLNILFSSGTTGDPKAIPWTQLTPIKAAMDGHFHHDIHHGDVVAWPTNLGWMMGPWLIFASLVNGAALALYDDAPNTAGFLRFVQRAGVTMLGVVPSLVAAWRSNGVTDGVDLSAVKVLSSTGEASDPEDMAWLMEEAGAKPMIEYCGGTEIGGGYITGTVVQEAIPGAFSTPALGLDVTILDDDGHPAPSGELFIVGPSVGLSTELLNRDHHEVYFAGVPRPGLRRHGDHMQRLDNGYFRALGRVDDTMNLGGIKVSSAEIERAVSAVDGVTEVAAVAMAPQGGGPSRLVLFAVPDGTAVLEPDLLRDEMQRRIAEHLNPLFKVAAVELIDELPRTASAKVMRRKLREARSEGRGAG